MLNKIVFFLLKKKVETATGTIDEVSKTKIFMLIEGVSRLIEFAGPYFNHPYYFSEAFHMTMYSLAGISYASRVPAKQ